MHFSKSTTGAAVLLAFAPTVLSMGSAIINNNCDFDVYYASVSNEAVGLQLLGAGGMSEQYSTQAGGGGVSIKLATENSLSGPISQFEYTLSGNTIFWDLSNINGGGGTSGYPFAEGGVIITPSMENDPANPTCIPVDCPAGQLTCAAAYNAPDDTRTMACNADSDLTMTLCPGGSAKRSVQLARSVHAHQRMHARYMPRK